MKNLITLFIVSFFALTLKGQETNNWIIKAGLGSFSLKDDHFSNDIIWDLNISYRFKNIEVGGFYQQTNTVFVSESENVKSSTKVKFELYGISTSFHFLPYLIKNKKANEIFDLYANTQLGLSYVKRTNLSSKVGQHIFWGLGANIYPTKKVGVFVEYGYRWFSNDNTLNLNQPLFFAGVTTRSLFFNYDDSNRPYKWTMKVGTIIHDSYERNHGNIRLDASYKINKIFEPGIYFGLSNAPSNVSNDYSPDFGINANIHLIPLFLQKSNHNFELYFTGKVGGYYINGEDIQEDNFGFTAYIGIGSSFFIWKHLGLFLEYNYGFADFSLYKDNIVRTGLAYRF